MKSFGQRLRPEMFEFVLTSCTQIQKYLQELFPDQGRTRLLQLLWQLSLAHLESRSLGKLRLCRGVGSLPWDPQRAADTMIRH